MAPNLESIIAISLLLYVIGVYGLISKRNLLRLIFSIEIMINAAIVNFVGFAVYLGLSVSLAQIIGLMIIALAAAEAAVGLALVLEAHRLHKDVVVDYLKELRG